MTILTVKSNAKKHCANCTLSNLGVFPFVSFFTVFLIEGILFYNIVLVSAMHHHESTIGIYIYISPSSWTSTPPPTPSHCCRSSQSTGFEHPTSYSKFPLDICFTYGNEHVSELGFQLVPPSPSQDNHDDVMTHLEPHILESEVKWALGSTSMNKASGSDGIQADLFQILKDDTVKVL